MTPTSFSYCLLPDGLYSRIPLNWLLRDDSYNLRYTALIGNDAYTIVDMATWGWARLSAFILGDEAAKLVNVKRFLGDIEQRPAAARAIARECMMKRDVFCSRTSPLPPLEGYFLILG